MVETKAAVVGETSSLPHRYQTDRQERNASNATLFAAAYARGGRRRFDSLAKTKQT